MNPHIINILIKGHAEKTKEEIEKANVIAHLQGQYIAEALLCTVGNMFSGKSSKKHKYPNKPYELNKSKKEMTEEELQRQRELFVAKLQVMKANFEIDHKKKEEAQNG